jgi:ribosomal-protein-alanine N-acetyltransferase
VAFILSCIVADEAEILSVAVLPAWRKYKIARALLALHLRHLAGRGVRKLFLEVDEGNAAARRLYTRAGFAQVGQRDGYYANATGKRSAALVMRREL